MDLKTKIESRIRKVKQLKEPEELLEKTVTPGLEKVVVKKPRKPPIKAPRQK